MPYKPGGGGKSSKGGGGGGKPTGGPKAPAGTEKMSPGAQALVRSFDKLNTPGNRVSLDKLEATSGLTRDQFTSAMREARLGGVLSLDSHESFTQTLSPAQLKSAIREAGSVLVYASRR